MLSLPIDTICQIWIRLRNSTNNSRTTIERWPRWSSSPLCTTIVTFLFLCTYDITWYHALYEFLTQRKGHITSLIQLFLEQSRAFYDLQAKTVLDKNTETRLRLCVEVAKNLEEWLWVVRRGNLFQFYRWTLSTQIPCESSVSFFCTPLYA